MLFAFVTNVETLEEFYRRCMAQNANTEEEKNWILCEMVEEGLLTNVTITERSKEEYIKDLSKNFNVLHIKKKEEENEN